MRLSDDLSELMARQDAMATSRQLADHGIGRWQRSRLVADGWIVRVAPRVYRLRGAPDAMLWRLRAGLLSLGDGSCVSFESAAVLHGFPGADRRVVEFSVARRHRSVVTPFVVHTTDHLDGIDIVERFGLPTTAPARTILDLALAGADDTRLEATIITAIRAETLTLEHLRARADALGGPGRWGSRRTQRIIDRLATASPARPAPPTARLR